MLSRIVNGVGSRPYTASTLFSQGNCGALDFGYRQAGYGFPGLSYVDGVAGKDDLGKTMEGR